MLNTYLRNAMLGLRIGAVLVARDQLKLALAEANRENDMQAKAFIFRAMNYARHATQSSDAVLGEIAAHNQRERVVA